VSPARLALFDCDGTLADSQHEIVSAMGAAFAAINRPPPPAHAIRTNIGRSLPAMANMLLPDAEAAERSRLVDAYREAYFTARSQAGVLPEPLYVGIPQLLDRLRDAGWVLGVATGKSRRGLDRLLAAHGIASQFATLQTADSHPSKPDPAMLVAACAETGIAPTSTVMIGDTEFDMAMAVKGGARAIGVAWGYHDHATLTAAGADQIVTSPEALFDLLVP
jgi:phosphoglycolate phosphatase